MPGGRGLCVRNRELWRLPALCFRDEILNLFQVFLPVFYISLHQARNRDLVIPPGAHAEILLKGLRRDRQILRFGALLIGTEQLTSQPISPIQFQRVAQH